MITQPSNLLRLLWVSHSSELFSCYISSLHSHSATLISDDVFQMMMFPFPFHLHWALQEVVWTLWNCDVVVGFRFVDFLWMLPFKAARLMPLQLIVQLKGHQSDLSKWFLQHTYYAQEDIFCRLRWLKWGTQIYIQQFSMQFNLNFTIQTKKFYWLLFWIFWRVEMIKMCIWEANRKAWFFLLKFGETFGASMYI